MKNKSVWILAGYCCILYGLWISAVPLLDPDEPVYGQTAKEMIQSGDWLSPRIYGSFWYDKPPFFYWMEALSYQFLGVSVFSSRLPALLSGLFTVVFLYESSRKPFGEKAAFWGALICASSLEIVLLSRSAVTDMTLTAALTAALMGFLTSRYVTAYAACGAALLIKGPIGFAFPAFIVLLWLVSLHRFSFKELGRIRWYWGIPLACAVGFPWYIYMASVHGAPFIDTFLGYHNITRFLSPEHAGQDHVWLYIPVLLIGFFPWSGTLPLLFHFRRLIWNHEGARYLLIWCAVIFLFFSFSSTQLISYILPMFPPLSLLAGFCLTQADVRLRSFPAAHIFFQCLTGAALAASPLLPEGGRAVQYGSAAFLCLEGPAAAYLWVKGHRSFMMALQCIMMVGFIASVYTLYSVPVTKSFTSERIVRHMEMTEKDPSIPLYIDPFYRPASAFYTDIYGLPMPPLAGSDRLPGRAYILIQKKLYDRWPERNSASWTLLWETDTGAFFLKEKGASQ
jgi:4-amino-4-deoxy-L-arabinose transferase-like glycosyltransferase